MNQSSHDAKEKLPWTEKYRPSSLDQLIGQEVVSHTFAKCLITQQLPHLLLSGPPGCGKTSSILVLAKQLFGYGLSFFQERYFWGCFLICLIIVNGSKVSTIEKECSS